MQTVYIRASAPYEVQIGRGLLKEAGEQLKALLPACTVVLAADSTVDALYGGAAEASLIKAGYRVLRFSFPAGEESKNISVLSALLEFMGRERVTRTDCVAALGGGVTGDLAGLAAALYLRGIRYIQLPTTLLAAVDSSVGGKTAVDLGSGKNLAGAFHQPSLVLCDPDTFKTLPADIFRAGVAECVKYGVIYDAALFHRFRALPGEEEITEIIARCVAIKGEFVEADEFDHGVRRLLNFGHTAGHAVEALSGFSIPHGQAVAIGMAIIARAAAKRGLCAADCAGRIVDTLAACGLPTIAPYPAEQIAEAALSDKKRKGGTIALVVPREIGRAEALDMDVNELLPFFRAGMEEA